MAKSSSITIRIDPQIKSEADAVLSYLGMTTTEAVTVFLRQVVLNKGIPFLVQTPVYNAETMMALREAEAVANSNRRRFASADDMFVDLGIQ